MGKITMVRKRKTIEQYNNQAKEALEIRNRIADALVEKYGSLYKASKAVGRYPTYFYNPNNIHSIKTAYEFCQFADISLEYALTGKNKAPFSPLEITFKNIGVEYYKEQKKRNSSSEVQIIFRLNHGLIKDMTLNTLISLSRSFKRSIIYLIQG